LSRDPGGKDKLDLDQSLHDLGLTNEGDMIYCRVEELHGTTNKEIVPSVVAGATSSSTLHTTAGPLVIDLLESDDDEDNGSGDDEEVVSVSPPRGLSRKRPLSSKGTLVATTNKRIPPKQLDRNRPVPLTHPTKFQIVSYNVWFGPPDPEARQVYPQERMAAICQELKTCHDNLLVVGFQEITPSLREYLAPLLNSMGFRLCTQPLGADGSAYGIGLAISMELEIIETKFSPVEETCQGRGLLYVQTPTMIFATTHLESFMDQQTYTGATQREAQIAQAAAFCEDRMRDYPQLQLAMIAGDFNWDDERVRLTGPNRPLAQVVPGWKDVGKPLDYTYDGKENPMLSGNLRRRFDRCIYYTAQNIASAAPSTMLRKLGTKAIPSLTWTKKNPWNGTSKVVPVAPSDHFGIAITFEA
jgi:hypothetical protein